MSTRDQDFCHLNGSSLNALNNKMLNRRRLDILCDNYPVVQATLCSNGNAVQTPQQKHHRHADRRKCSTGHRANNPCLQSSVVAKMNSKHASREVCHCILEVPERDTPQCMSCCRPCWAPGFRFAAIVTTHVGVGFGE